MDNKTKLKVFVVAQKTKDDTGKTSVLHQLDKKKETGCSVSAGKVDEAG